LAVVEDRLLPGAIRPILRAPVNLFLRTFLTEHRKENKGGEERAQQSFTEGSEVSEGSQTEGKDFVSLAIFG
jgi:hypothetical protein